MKISFSMVRRYALNLDGVFVEFDSVVSLLGNAVQAVGLLQILEDLNVFLSVHILEPAITLDGFEPLY